MALSTAWLIPPLSRELPVVVARTPPSPFVGPFSAAAYAAVSAGVLAALRTCESATELLAATIVTRGTRGSWSRASLGPPAPSRAIASRHQLPLPLYAESSATELSAVPVRSAAPRGPSPLCAAGRELHLLPCGLHGHLGHSRHQYLCSARLLAVPVQHLDLFHDPFLHHRHLLLRQLLPLLLLLRDRLYDRFRSCLPSQAIVESPAQQITARITPSWRTAEAIHAALL